MYYEFDMEEPPFDLWEPEPDEVVECHACFGTGLDRELDSDCLRCYGDGVI